MTDTTPTQSETLLRPGASQETAGRSTNLIGTTFPRVDFYAIDDLLQPEEIAVRDAVTACSDRFVLSVRMYVM